jgi:hypothetical protein
MDSKKGKGKTKMKFKFTDPDLPELIEHFMIEGATELSEAVGKDLTKIWPEMFKKNLDPKGEEWELQVMLNGVELPAREVFDHIDSQVEEMVEKKALQIFKERFGDIEDLMCDIQGDIEERMRAAFPDFNPDKKEDDFDE